MPDALPQGDFIAVSDGPAIASADTLLATALAPNDTAHAAPGCITLEGGIFDPSIFDEAIFDCGTPVGSTAIAFKE